MLNHPCESHIHSSAKLNQTPETRNNIFGRALLTIARLHNSNIVAVQSTLVDDCICKAPRLALG